MSWKVPRIWEGGDVWIIGGGTSVPKQFDVPDEMIQQVRAGTLLPNVYSPYLSYLHDKHVIGVNVAYLIGDWMDMIFFGDNGFFLTHRKGLAQYPGLRVGCTSLSSADYAWVKNMKRDRKHNRGISERADTVSWNGNSGAAAISVAAHAGAKRIILLGFDMKLDNASRQHWHDIYKRGNITARKKRKLGTPPFDRHLRGFPMIARDAKRMKIEILNACPDSAIECFRKVTVKELMI